MTTSTYEPTVLAGNGVLDTFGIGFGFLGVSTNVKVSIKLDLTGAFTDQTAGVEYNITGSNIIFTGGNIPATGETVVAELNPDFLQSSVYKENAKFPAATVERDLDERNLESQVNQDLIARGFRVDTAEDISSTVMAVELPSSGTEVLTVDSTGLASSTAAALGVVTIPVSVANGGTGTTVLTSGEVLIGAGTSAVTTTASPQVTSIELGHATDTTIARVSAGVASLEGVNIVTTSSTDTLTNKTIELGGILDASSYWISFNDNKGILDSTNKEHLIFQEVANAANHFEMQNAATGASPSLMTAGTDANVSFQLQSKGTGAFLFGATSTTQSKVRLFEQTTNGGNYIELAPAAAIGTTGVLTLPEATDTLVGKATTDTLTNKTIDANGTGNSITNIDVADLATGTDGELITWDASANPTTVAVGTATHVLTSNGAGVAPTFQATSSAISQATQAAIEAETNEDTYIPPDLIKHSPGVSKGWARYNHTSAGLGLSYNVASITDNGPGDYTVNWDTDRSTTGVTLCIANHSGGSSSISSEVAASTQCTNRSSGGTLTDYSQVCVAMWGDF